MMCMRRPEESNTPYSLLSLLRWRRIHWPLELFKMTAPPSRTATPESLLVVVPPDRVNVSRYVASSFISSVTSLFNTVIESVPTAHISPRQVPLSWLAVTAAAEVVRFNSAPGRSASVHAALAPGSPGANRVSAPARLRAASAFIPW